MNNVEVIQETGDLPEYVDRIAGFALRILDRITLENWQMGILVTDDAGIREYNRQWRNIDKATDVLSFVQSEGDAVPLMPGMPVEAGDIVISLESVKRNADEWSIPFDLELRRVIIHGILHLKGMDHPRDDYETGMLKLQEELLAGTGSLLKDA